MAKAKKTQKKKTLVVQKKKVNKQPGTQIYEKKLLKMRDDLLKLVHQKQGADMPDVEVGDEADIATQSSERELLFELSDNERNVLDSIEAALRKIELAGYGVCETCHKKIPALRLQAMPHARYCVQCQSRFETPRR
jgi:DnaK suppressor protein